MKSIILVALALAAVAVAGPIEKEVQVLEQTLEQQPDGSYVRTLKLDDGTERFERGVLKEVVGEDNKPQVVLVVDGTYKYINEDQKLVEVSYTADENGYNAVGDSIPKAASQ